MDHQDVLQRHARGLSLHGQEKVAVTLSSCLRVDGAHILDLVVVDHAFVRLRQGKSLTREAEASQDSEGMEEHIESGKSGVVVVEMKTSERKKGIVGVLCGGRIWKRES